MSRQELSDILKSYQEEIGNTVSRLDGPFVVTGQQVGFMTGPLYTILKGITCLQVARQMNATPLFWVATEDHDVAEVSSAFRIDERGDLRRHKVDLPQGVFVEDIPFTQLKEVEVFAQAIGMPELVDVVRGSTRFAEAMIRLMVHAFRGTGLLFVEPRLLRPLAVDFFKREFELGPHLFFKDDAGKRVRVTPEMAERVGGEPERFSPDVMGRPVMQASVIPTLAYIAGPGEMTYYPETAELHAAHDVPMPKLIPRMHATFEMPELNAHAQGNLLHPRSKPQERVLNWWFFQGQTEVNLMEALDQFHSH